MIETIRIVVVHDNPLLRAGIANALRSCKDLSVVGQAASPAEVLALIGTKSPDVVVLNIDGAESATQQALTDIAQASSATRIVALANADDPERLAMLLRNGVSAYLLMTADKAEIAATVRRAVRRADSVLLATSRHTLHKLLLASSAKSTLSARETQVLSLLGEAHSNRQIARTLTINEGTVKRHLTNLYGKLGAGSRLEAVRKARAAGLL